MTSMIRAWGNSQGLYIPKSILKEMNIDVNDKVVMSVENGALIIRKESGADTRISAYEDLKRIRQAAAERISAENRDYRREYEEYLDERYNR